MRRCSTDSSASLHIQQKPAKTHPLLLSWSIFKIRPQVTSQAKKLTLVGAQESQIIFEGKVTSPLSSKIVHMVASNVRCERTLLQIPRPKLLKGVTSMPWTFCGPPCICQPKQKMIPQLKLENEEWCNMILHSYVYCKDGWLIWQNLSLDVIVWMCLQFLV